MASHSKVANGDIAPSRFVSLDTTADGKVIQSTAGLQVYGISQPSTDSPPWGALDTGLAAVAGGNVLVYGLGDKCMLEIGGTVTRGDRLKATTGGKGLTTTTNLDEYGAIAQASGTSGQLIEVLLVLGQISA